jgi:hypothetical protein
VKLSHKQPLQEEREEGRGQNENETRSAHDHIKKRWLFLDYIFSVPPHFLLLFRASFLLAIFIIQGKPRGKKGEERKEKRKRRAQ